MDKSGAIKWSLLFATIAVTGHALSAVPSGPVRMSSYIIPAVFADALSQGMKVPVFIRYDKAEKVKVSKQKIADALLSLRDGKFQINQLTLSDLPERTELSPQLITLLKELKNRRFSKGTYLRLSDDATLSLDTKSFYLELTISETATSARLLPRTTLLAASSADHLSSVLNYTTGSYYSQYGGMENTSSYLTLNNTSSWREHHINLNGSFYGIGTAGQRGDLYRTMYERDFQGYRFAVGMVDTWNLQSVASLNALNSSRIYGISYGNKSSTQAEDNTLSLVPVTVFLPAAGEVHVYRQGKLLSIQSFNMGSYEVDTSRLPFGIYNVDVQVVVNGKIVSSRSSQINKTYSRYSSVTGVMAWQFFGGMLQYNKKDYRHNRLASYEKKETWLSGISVSSTQPWLSGVNVKSTLYGFDNNGVNELEVNFTLNDSASLNQQILLATDRNWQSISTLNLSVPGGYGAVWGSREISSAGGNLPLQRNDSYIIGATANLNNIVSWLGRLSVSRTDNKYNKNSYVSADYNQSLLSRRYYSVEISTGVQQYSYNKENDFREKYINLRVTLPFYTWLSSGVSSENGNVLANITAQKNIRDSGITQLGGAVSRRIGNSGSSSDESNNYTANGFVSYDTKYNTGMVSVAHSSEKSSNISFNSQGTVGWAKNTLSFGKDIQHAGVMVKTDFSENEKIIAKINGRNYPLSGRNNFIGLPAYSEYRIELMNDKNSPDSVDIVSGRQNRLVLYPGNIGVITPDIKQQVTVFGRIRRQDGSLYTNAEIASHTGKTHTDEYGEFAMDMDKHFPVITLTGNADESCEAVLDINKARGAIWVGDVECLLQKHVASRN